MRTPINCLSPLLFLIIFGLLSGCEDATPSPTEAMQPDVTAPHEQHTGTSDTQDDGTGDTDQLMAGMAMAGESISSQAGSEADMEVSTQSGEEVGDPAGTEGGNNDSTSMGGMRMPSCLISCAEFVECTIKQCPGYDEEDDALLMEECLDLCTPTIAELFDRLMGCADKLRFASTVRTDFLDFCDSATEGFCETYIATCGEWLGNRACEEHYNQSPRSGPSYTEGAHRSCYEYHLGSAMRALDQDDPMGVQLGCERAAGLTVCVE